MTCCIPGNILEFIRHQFIFPQWKKLSARPHSFPLLTQGELYILGPCFISPLWYSSYCILGISIALRILNKNFVIAIFFYIISRLLLHLRHFHLEIYYCKPLKRFYFQICVSNMFGPFSELVIFLKPIWHIHSKQHLQKVNKCSSLF